MSTLPNKQWRARYYNFLRSFLRPPSLRASVRPSVVRLDFCAHSESRHASLRCPAAGGRGIFRGSGGGGESAALSSRPSVLED